MIAAIHHAADLSILFVLLAIVVAAIGVYFLWVREFVGAFIALIIAILIVWFLT